MRDPAKQIPRGPLHTVACHHCGHTWEFTPPMGRAASCPQCHRDARCCLNCRFYEPSAHRSCREAQAGWVKEKDRANFCSYFSPTTAAAAQADHDAKDRLAALFADHQKPQPEPAAKSLGDELARFLAGKR